MESFGFSHPGLCRERNEDSYLIEPTRGVFAVADGLGGLRYGEVASRVAIRVLQDFPDSGFPDLRVVAAKADRAVAREGVRFRCRIGTTLTMAHISTGRLLRIAQIGDSMAFLLPPGGELLPLTSEQTEGERLRRSGVATVDPFLDHVLVQCIGQGGGVEPEFVSRTVAPGSRIILCSDGVSKVVPVSRIGNLTAGADSTEALVNSLIAAALDDGGPDNATVVAVFV